jgi:DNA-binding response OmpR family regulator
MGRKRSLRGLAPCGIPALRTYSDARMSGCGLPDLVNSRDLGFELKQRTLLVSGRRVLLDARSAVVLQALAERFGELVSKDDLLATAWPGQIVHENSLAKSISRLRAAIHGSGLVITATYGYGYTLQHPGRNARHEDISENVDERSGPDVPLKVSGKRWIALGSLALLTAAAAITFATNRSEPEVALRTTAPMTNDAADAVATVLWVDDHPANNSLEVEYFKRQKIAVHLAENSEDALKLLKMNKYRLVISDLGRGEDRLAGLKLLQTLKRQGIDVPAIIYTMRPEDPAKREAQKRMVAEAGAVDLTLTPLEVRSKVVERLATDWGAVPHRQR